MARVPNEDEAAAIAAAIQRFVAETAVAPDGQAEATGPWQRRALLEGVSAKEAFDPQGGDRWLS